MNYSALQKVAGALRVPQLFNPEGFVSGWLTAHGVMPATYSANLAPRTTPVAFETDR